MRLRRWADWPGHALLALPVRWYLGAVFIGACLHKIASPEAFALDIATYRILPIEAVAPMAITLPWIELAAGLALVAAWRTRAAALLVAGMMVMFVAALAIALGRGLEMGCGCFASSGMEEDPISVLTVLRDLAWLALAGHVAAFDRRPLGLDRWLAARSRRSRLDTRPR